MVDASGGRRMGEGGRREREGVKRGEERGESVRKKRATAGRRGGDRCALTPTTACFWKKSAVVARWTDLVNALCWLCGGQKIGGEDGREPRVAQVRRPRRPLGRRDGPLAVSLTHERTVASRNCSRLPVSSPLSRHTRQGSEREGEGEGDRSSPPLPDISTACPCFRRLVTTFLSTTVLTAAGAASAPYRRARGRHVDGTCAVRSGPVSRSW